MHDDLTVKLGRLRAQRRFDPELYVEAKVRLINRYFRRSGLRAAVLGVSGGIDSAVTLALLQRARRAADSPIDRIVGALMPMHVREGTTNQSEATARGRETLEALGGDLVTIDLSETHDLNKSIVDGALDVRGDAWAAGQLVSNIRTPSLYYAASLLTQKGTPALVVGTTNRDEGAYIGYFGKAADGLVDLQPISDAHKSEIYLLAELLGVPRSVREAAPTGDIYDGRNDEQLIGTSYDAIELYSLYRCLPEKDQHAFRADLSSTAEDQFGRIARRLDTLNKQCAHKYVGGSSSAHLDVYPRAVPGGWRDDVDADEVLKYLARDRRFNAPFDLGKGHLAEDPSVLARRRPLGNFGEAAGLVENLLTSEECDALVETLRDQAWVSVGIHGRAEDETELGSWRATAHDEAFARALWERLRPELPPVRLFDEHSLTDAGEDPVWRPVGISPALRFIRYRDRGSLVPHYDAPFDYWEGRRTLMSVIVYLTDHESTEGGRTRFIVDPQSAVPFAERDYADWPREALPAEVTHAVVPRRGSALVFDHRVLHDSEPFLSTREKIILRTDVIFERGGPRRSTPAYHSKALGFPVASELQAPLEPRLMEKVMEDPWYASVWARHRSRVELERAGFFDDGLPVGESMRSDPAWLSTPFEKIFSNLEQAEVRAGLATKTPVVLVSTGGFTPIHEGHLRMLEVAKAELEARGFEVLGGYLSPSHDEYVRKRGPEALDAHHRLQLCEKAVADSPWLMVDGWEALDRPKPVNFTAVIAHLESYLARHVATPRPIEVVYVFGGDNAGFAHAFLERGRAVCVKRPDWEERFQAVASDPAVRACDRIVLIDRPIGSANISAGAARDGDLSNVSTAVAEQMSIWNEASGRAIDGLYCIRNEGLEAVRGWTTRVSLKQLDDFRERLLDLIRQSFSETKALGPRYDVTFRVTDLEEQKKVAARLACDYEIISMDPLIPGRHDLAVSRRFALASAAGRPRIVARPGHSDLEAQIAAIPPGRYVLMDDDIATGTTMRQVMGLLPPSIEIGECKALVKGCDLGGKDEKLDVLDVRDFLCGAREGGLVVRLPSGEPARAPYAWPYVSASARASIPVDRNVAFSRAVWKLNRDFFLGLDRAVTLGEVDPAFRTLMHYVGFEDADRLASICAWHVERLLVAPRISPGVSTRPRCKTAHDLSTQSIRPDREPRAGDDVVGAFDFGAAAGGGHSGGSEALHGRSEPPGP